METSEFEFSWNSTKPHETLKLKIFKNSPAVLYIYMHKIPFNTLRPRQNDCHFTDDSFKCIFLNENVWILIEISLNFVPRGEINTISALAQIMTWHHPGDKALSEPIMVRLLTHICVTWPQWVKLPHNLHFNLCLYMYNMSDSKSPKLYFCNFPSFKSDFFYSTWW